MGGAQVHMTIEDMRRDYKKGAANGESDVQIVMSIGKFANYRERSPKTVMSYPKIRLND